MKCIPLLLLVLGAGRTILAEPSLNFPISEQYPPVARLDEAYSFTFSAYTFKSTDGGDLTYSASNLPKWLSFDDSTLAFSGTPTASTDVGFSSFTLTATDSSDNTNASATVSIAVSSATAPSVAIPCYEQLQENYTSYSGSGISLTAGDSFTFQFAGDTFKGNVSAVYGLFSGRTPLPSWIYFDSGAMKFVGTAPALSSSIAPPLEFGFVLVATDIPGYSAAESSFNIVVGHHSLQASPVVVNATEGKPFEQTLDVTLDGKDISSSNISSVSVNGTLDWMVFDNDTLTLSGTPDDDKDVGEDTQVSVTIIDVYGDEVEVSIDVIVMSPNTTSSVFGTSGLKNVTAERGQNFNYTLPLVSDSDIGSVAVTYVPSSTSSWLSFDESTHEFSGEVPNNLDNVEVIVSVETKSGSKQTAQFYITGKGTVTTSTSASASSATVSATTSATASKSTTSATAMSSASGSTTATLSPTATAASTSAVSNSKTSNRTVAIVCGVLIPIAVACAGFVVWYCCCLGGISGRRRSRASSATQVSPTASHNISKPIPIEDDWPLPPPSRPGRTWSPPRRLSGMSVFSSHRHSYSDLEKQPHEVDGGFVIPYDPNNPSRPRRSRMFSSHSSIRDSLASLATVATTEIFSVRLVESSQGDIAGLASRRHSRNTSGSRSGGSGSGSSSTIGPYSTSSGDSPSRLRAVREEDIGDDLVGLVGPPTVLQEAESEEIDEEYSSSASEQSSQHFEMVPGAERQWRRTSNAEAAQHEPQLVEFTNGGTASRRSVSGHAGTASVSSDDGQVFL
ncbi:hypothetical protein POJ06DRAFT_262135 [Lipomyces tetrasporus]|uniref:Dystroglycan-type cadherin-like domain-containing protein n=1 Tax=Lipomyces tetrasporus TaxID=54092 RepID=A0AAD7QKL1_9ASCO|nr:uncharacterized protein POJ06DRAFT_262135 [Lipomyces tetrasporus]KAJ8096973.1 hypothetical protein POJ06DRAFT_262135 [Lipomyces tetrasporus]